MCFNNNNNNDKYNYFAVHQWQILVTLVASCINIKVAPCNLSIVASMGMQVYITLLNFKKDCTCKFLMGYNSFKIMVSHTLVFWRTTFSSTIKNKWENHKMYFIIHLYNYLETWRDFCRLSYLLMLWSSARYDQLLCLLRIYSRPLLITWCDFIKSEWKIGRPFSTCTDSCHKLNNM